MRNEVDEDLLALQRAARRRRVAMFVFIGVLIAIPITCIGQPWVRAWQARRENRLSVADRAELEGLLGQLDAETAKREKAWQAAATRMNLAKIEPSAEDCEVPLAPPTYEAAHSYVNSGSIDGNYFGSWTLLEVEPGQPVGACGVCGVGTEGERQRLAEGEATKSDLSWARDHVQYPGGGYEVVLLVDDRREGVVMGHSFIAGEVTGRAYLYDATAGRFICAGDVHAENSDLVNSSYSYYADDPLDEGLQANEGLRAALRRDLSVQTRKAIAKSMSGL